MISVCMYVATNINPNAYTLYVKLFTFPTGITKQYI